MNNKKDISKLRTAYLFQGVNIDFSKSGAAQLHMLHTLYGLQERGHDVSLMSLQPQRRVLFTDDLEAVTSGQLDERHYASAGLSDQQIFRFFESVVRRVHKTLKLPYFAFFDIFRMFNASVQNLQGYDLIHERYNPHTLGGMIACKRLNIPYVLEVNADPIAEFEHQSMPLPAIIRYLFNWEKRLLAKNAAKIISVSSQLKDFLISDWGLAPEKISVLPNAADTDVFGREYDTDEIRRKAGLSDDPMIVFIGGFYPWQDLHLLLDSCAIVLRRFPRTKLVLIGDGNTKPEIKRKITDDGLEDAVVITGRIEHSKIPEMLSIADIAVAPNIPFFPGYGGSPLKLFEYMASGKAVVATNTGQIAEIISPGQDGLLVDPGDVNGFAQAIESLLSDHQLKETLGRNASQKIREKYTQRHYAEQLEAIYLEVLQN